MFLWPRSQFIRLLLLACCTASTPALAQQKKQRATIQVEEFKRTKKARKGSPRLNRSAVFVVEVERKLIKDIDKTIVYLKRTAASMPKKSQGRLNVLERMLNLSMEQATYVRSEEERRYDRSWRGWDVGGRKGREPVINTKRSARYWQDVVKFSRQILDDFPNTKTADVVTYNQAVALQYLQRESDAARIYTRLIERYPNSDIAGQAYASLGDYYFDRNDFRNAKRNYQASTKYRRSKRYLWSIFKLGWCSYNLAQYQEALKFWKLVVRKTRSRSGKETNLREEALRDMVYVFAELRQIDGAISYYKANNGGKYIGPFLTLLAQILADQGEYSEAIKVLKRFQRVAPYDEDGPASQKEIVSLFYALNRLDPVWKELSRFRLLYGPNSAWASRNEKKVVLETQAMIRDQILYYASLTHQKAIKDENLELNREARKGYLLFLKDFPKSKLVPTVNFFLADIEYVLKNYKQAGFYYLEIASLGKKRAIRYNLKTNKATNMHKVAAVEMVRSYVQDFEPQFKILRKQKPNFKRPRKLSIQARNYLRACARYIKWYPKDRVRVKSCETGVTKVYYHSGYKKKAIENLTLIANNYSKDKDGPASVDLLVPLISNNRPLLLSTVQGFLKKPTYQKGKMGKRLRTIIRNAEKEDISREKDTLKRARRYQAQAVKFPNDPDVDKLWYNAAVDYVRAGAFTPAITAYLTVVRKYPKKAQAKLALLEVAKIYDKLLELGKGSDFYFAYGNKYPKDANAQQAMARACELSIATESPKAPDVCDRFALRYPSIASFQIERLINVGLRRKNDSLVQKVVRNTYLKRLPLTPNQQIRAYHALMKSSGKQGSLNNQILQVFRRNTDKVDGQALAYVGEIYFQAAAPRMRAFRSVKLQGGTVENLVATIERKVIALNDLEQAYAQVTQTGDPQWGVAALYQVGKANEEFSEDLANPPAINGAKKADVIKQLQPQILDRKKTALTWYSTAADTVKKIGIFNAWGVRVAEAVARAKGQQLDFKDYVTKPEFLGTEISSALVSQIKR